MGTSTLTSHSHRVERHLPRRTDYSAANCARPAPSPALRGLSWEETTSARPVHAQSDPNTVRRQARSGIAVRSPASGDQCLRERRSTRQGQHLYSKGQCSLTVFQPSYNSTGLEYDHASVRVRSLDASKGLETRPLAQVVYRLPCIL